MALTDTDIVQRAVALCAGMGLGALIEALQNAAAPGSILIASRGPTGFSVRELTVPAAPLFAMEGTEIMNATFDVGRLTLSFYTGSLVGLLVGEILARRVPALSVLRQPSRTVGFDLGLVAIRIRFTLAALIGGLGFVCLAGWWAVR